MIGYRLFLQKLDELLLEDRKQVITNIVGIPVRLFSLEAFYDCVVLKFYDGYTYYQLNFIFNDDKDSKTVKRDMDRIVICDIFVNNIESEIDEGLYIGKNLYKFIKILRDGDINYFEFFL